MGFNPFTCVFGNFVLQQRYLLIIMLQLALLNAYHLRVVLNIAIHEMVEDQNDTIKINACPQYTLEKTEKIEGGTFPWDDDLEAFILYAFFCSYFISHMPGGWLADRIGGRHVMGTCMVVSSISTILFPISIQYGGHTGAIISRMILGFAQGPLLPTISTFIQCWVPKHQRALLGGMAFGGSNLGTVTGSIFTGMIIENTGSWVLPFYIWGFVSLVFCIFYYTYVFSRPSSHPYISEEELKYLEAEVEHRKHFKVPWLKVLLSRPVWALVAGQWSHNIIFFTLLTNLPKYLKEILKFNIQANAIATAMPFLGLWISNILFSYTTNIMINREWISVLNARRLNTSFACIFPSMLLLVMVYIGCHREISLVLVFFTMFFMGPYFSGMKVNVNDISIHYGGTLMAIVNGVGSLPGILGPFLVGALTKEESLESWQKIFWIIFGIDIILSLVYIIFAQAERQSWDYIDDQ